MTRSVVYVNGTSEIGGADICLYNLVSSLDRSRWRSIVVLPKPGPLVPRLEAAGVTVRILPMVQLRTGTRIRHHLGYATHFWPAVYRLASMIRREGASVVHTNSLYCMYGPWAARLARVPHIWHIREIPDVPPLAITLATRLAVGMSARVITMSDGVAVPFRAIQSANAKVMTIYDGIDVAAFDSGIDGMRVRRRFGIPDAAPLAGFVGRLDPWKGCDVFLRAAAIVVRRHPEARFIVCGGALDGYEDHAASLKRLALELAINDRVSFTGWTDPAEIPQVMAALDVFVHTSVRPEPFGLVLVEAMAAAKPVIGSDGGGVPEVVEDGVTGLLSKPGEAAGAAAAINQLFDDRVKAASMGRAGRRRAEQLFEVHGYARRVEAIYEDVLGARN